MIPTKDTREIDAAVAQLEEAIGILFQAEEMARRARDLVGIASRSLVNIMMNYRVDNKRKKR